LDCTWSKGKNHRRPHGDPTASDRIFVNQQGVRRGYRFGRNESRVFEEQALERQSARGVVPADVEARPERPFAE
jgi:hypothetical protein